MLPILIFLIPAFNAAVFSIQKDSKSLNIYSALPVTLSSPDQIDHSEAITTCLKKIHQNIFTNCTILASPSTQSPNYYYHWVRDSSITLSVLQDWITNHTEKLHLLDQFAILTTFHQDQAIRFGSAGLGEPKFYVNGNVYELPWGRPQNDGPALRFLTFAKYLYRNQRIEDRTNWWYVPQLPPSSPLKRDIEYVAHHWRDSCFDLWEEIRAIHFYSRMVMYSSLEAGVYVALRYDDLGAAKFYRQEAERVLVEMDWFWDSSLSIISSFINEDSFINQDDSMKIQKRTSRLDIAVILACLHTLDFPVPGYHCTDDKILITAAKLFYHFKTEYPINFGHFYPLLGRYPQDQYDGVGVSIGNPWILSTHAFAELCLVLANSIQSFEKEYSVTPYQLVFFDAVVPNLVLSTGKLNDQTKKNLINALERASQGFLDRVAMYTSSTTFSEQLDRETGKSRGASNLTWSYSSFLSVMTAEKHLN